MWPLVALLASRALQILARHRIAVGVGGTAVVTDITLDWLRQEAIEAAPGSDPEALEEAARTTMRLLGLQGDEVLWPRHRRGDNAGQPITPNYFVLNLNTGQAWYSSQYRSFKSVQAANRRGFTRGIERGKRDIATITNAQGRN